MAHAGPSKVAGSSTRTIHKRLEIEDTPQNYRPIRKVPASVPAGAVAPHVDPNKPIASIDTAPTPRPVTPRHHLHQTDTTVWKENVAPARPASARQQRLEQVFYAHDPVVKGQEVQFRSSVRPATAPVSGDDTNFRPSRKPTPVNCTTESADPQFRPRVKAVPGRSMISNSDNEVRPPSRHLPSNSHMVQPSNPITHAVPVTEEKKVSIRTNYNTSLVDTPHESRRPLRKQNDMQTMYGRKQDNMDEQPRRTLKTPRSVPQDNDDVFQYRHSAGICPSERTLPNKSTTVQDRQQTLRAATPATSENNYSQFLANKARATATNNIFG